MLSGASGVIQDLHYVVHILFIDSFLAPGNFFPREPLDQLEISAITECELKRFSGAFRAGAPSPLARARSLFRSLLPSACYASYTGKKNTQKNLREGWCPPPPPISFLVRPRVKLTLINLGGVQCLVAINITINTDNCKVATS